jgi:hypothetical protein
MMNIPHPANILHGRVAQDTLIGKKHHEMLPGLILDSKLGSTKAHGIGTGRLEGHIRHTVSQEQYTSLVKKTTEKAPATKVKSSAYGSMTYPGTSF